MPPDGSPPYDAFDVIVKLGPSDRFPQINGSHCASNWSAGPYASLIEILIVCTANICRSPMAEALFRSRLTEHGVDCEVSSAGLLEGGHPSPPEVVMTMAEVGCDLEGHISRQVTSEDLLAADLTLTMERQHLRAVVVMEPETWRNTLTLKEMVRRGKETGPRAEDQSIESFIESVHSERELANLLGDSLDDDVADPYGGAFADYEFTRRELDALVSDVVDLLWPPSFEGGGPAEGGVATVDRGTAGLSANARPRTELPPREIAEGAMSSPEVPSTSRWLRRSRRFGQERQ